MSNPTLQECAEHLARDFHRAYMRNGGAGPVRFNPKGVTERQFTQAFYSLLYSGAIVCPKPEHRIKVGLRDTPSD